MRLFFAAVDIIPFYQLQSGFFTWVARRGEGRALGEMRPGDVLLVKFAKDPIYKKEYINSITSYFAQQHEDFDVWVRRYDEEIKHGQRAMFRSWTVSAAPIERLHDLARHPKEPMTLVEFAVRSTFAHPLSLDDVLALRALPLELRRQIKGTVAEGNHIQELDRPDECLAQVEAAGAVADKSAYLERYYVAIEAALLPALRPGDRVFRVARDGRLLGDYVADDAGTETARATMQRTIGELEHMLELHDARNGHEPVGYMKLAARDIRKLLASEKTSKTVQDFSTYHNRFAILPKKTARLGSWLAAHEVTTTKTPQAAQVDGVSAVGEGGPIVVPERGPTAAVSLEALLTPDRVQAYCRELVLPPQTIVDAVAAIRSGKHVVLVGPPGTGKSALAIALCRAAVGGEGGNYQIATATSDWSSFEVIGGFMPREDGKLQFQEGIVLECLRENRWLLIDELNRADVDKSFGPLMTLLSGFADKAMPVSLPFRVSKDGSTRRLTVGHAGSHADYEMAQDWRLIATLNLYDKASLFQLSYAFMRRFAFIHVDVPEAGMYRALLEAAGTIKHLPAAVVDATHEIALATSRRIGPAIALDMLALTAKALEFAEGEEDDDTEPDWQTAWLSAVSALLVPQFEGTSAKDALDLYMVAKKWAPTSPQLAEVKAHLALVTGVVELWTA